MKEYTIKPGQHDWNPIDGVSLPFQSFKRRWRVRFDASCWYDPKKFGDHWNKGGGFYPFFSFRKNKDSFMWAWRPDTEPDVFQVTWYANDRLGGYATGTEAKVKALQWFDVEIWKVVRRCTFDVYDSISGEVLATGDHYLRRDFGFYGEIGLYFGGQPAAPHEMRIDLGRVPISKNIVHEGA